MVDKETIRRGYDELADVHAAERTDDDRGMSILTQFLDSLSNPQSVLDAGCGQGTPTTFVTVRSPRVSRTNRGTCSMCKLVSVIGVSGGVIVPTVETVVSNDLQQWNRRGPKRAETRSL